MEIYKWFKKVLLAVCAVLMFALFVVFTVNVFVNFTNYYMEIDQKALLIVILILSFAAFLLSIFFYRKHDEVSVKAYIIFGAIIFAVVTAAFISIIVEYTNSFWREPSQIVMPILIEVFSVLILAGYIGAAVVTKYIEKHDN